MKRSTDVVIVGGGLAGISCARVLTEKGIDFLLVEASEALGGRVRSDIVNGYVLDRGFQVFNSCYTETLNMLGKDAPKFHAFRSGALIKTQKGFLPYCDPLREPKYALATALAEIGSFLDKLRMLALRKDSLKDSSFSSRTIIDELRNRKFSKDIIEKFFRPFLGGVFLDSSLNTSSTAFQQVFKNFSRGVALLPEGGMGEITRRLAAPLSPERVMLNRRVTDLSAGRVTLADGEEINTKQIVLALDVEALKSLLPEISLPTARCVLCYYFEAEDLPNLDKFLVLVGTGTGLINNLAVLSSVVSSYSPSKKQLLSVTVLPQDNTESLIDSDKIQQELQDWFPGGVFSYLSSYLVKSALPQQAPQALQCVTLPEGFHLCGDVASIQDYGLASIENAVKSGKAAAEAILRLNLKD